MSMPENGLDPKADPFDSPDTPADHEPKTVATPEGDNEFAPDQPLKPIQETEGTLQTPRGQGPQAYKQDKQ
jgi:hypothetical protein